MRYATEATASSVVEVLSVPFEPRPEMAWCHLYGITDAGESCSEEALRHPTASFGRGLAVQESQKHADTNDDANSKA